METLKEKFSQFNGFTDDIFTTEENDEEEENRGFEDIDFLKEIIDFDKEMNLIELEE